MLSHCWYSGRLIQIIQLNTYAYQADIIVLVHSFSSTTTGLFLNSLTGLNLQLLCSRLLQIMPVDILT